MKEKINLQKVPQHIAVIMDGNGRWAKQRGAKRIFGHKNAVQAVREVCTASAELGVKFLTLYAFSTENWNRPKEEINALMQLMVSTIKKEVPTLLKNNIRLATIGNIEQLPLDCQEGLAEAKRLTAHNDGMILVMALSYSGRWEIVEAIKDIVKDVETKKIDISQLSESLVANYLTTHSIPDPELMIRTSGEQRISNFLLWQVAYSEFVFTEVLWPDFRKEHLYEAIVEYQSRERRFGKISEQINA